MSKMHFLNVKRSITGSYVGRIGLSENCSRRVNADLSFATSYF